MLQIEQLHNLCADRSIAITKHAKDRLVERKISIDDVKNAVKTGEIIKQYTDDKPFPSCLVLGESVDKDSVHVVASIDNEYLYIITAYYPSEDEWEDDMKTRKERL